jgi:hypothetical protein
METTFRVMLYVRNWKDKFVTILNIYKFALS